MSKYKTKKQVFKVIDISQKYSNSADESEHQDEFLKYLNNRIDCFEGLTDDEVEFIKNRVRNGIVMSKTEEELVKESIAAIYHKFNGNFN